mmetsp:Transcript_24704/g.32246  ORF Transcript_24704/g.32246 Transcript_24704/m.32246 type:complete len:149 (+) Transcript_24704:164-610(+)
MLSQNSVRKKSGKINYVKYGSLASSGFGRSHHEMKLNQQLDEIRNRTVAEKAKHDSPNLVRQTKLCEENFQLSIKIGDMNVKSKQIASKREELEEQLNKKQHRLAQVHLLQAEDLLRRAGSCLEKNEDLQNALSFYNQALSHLEKIKK